MDRILELKSSTESIKKTMLMHEDIFKHQIKELHRLYNLQRKLMLELKNEMSMIEDSRVLHKSMINKIPHINLSTSQQPKRETGFNLYGLRDDEQRETSGSCLGEINNSKILILPIRGLNVESLIKSPITWDNEPQDLPTPTSRDQNTTMLASQRSGSRRLELPPADEEGTSTSNYEQYEKSNNKMRNIDKCDDDEEETNVELTLSIGPRNSKKRLRLLR